MIKSDKEIVKQFRKHRKISERGLSLQKTEDTINMGYWAGDEQFYNTNITDETKEMVVLNRVKPFVDAVTGFMIQNRRRPKYQSLDINPRSSKCPVKSLVCNLCITTIMREVFLLFCLETNV